MTRIVMYLICIAAFGLAGVLPSIPTSANTSVEMMLKRGEKIERYTSSGQIGQDEGAKTGITDRMKDGGIVYVPEQLHF